MSARLGCVIIFAALVALAMAEAINGFNALLNVTLNK